MDKTLAELAEFVDGDVVGDESIRVTGVQGIKEASPGDLTFMSNPKYVSQAQKTNASAIVVPRDFVLEGKSIIRTDNPSLAFAQIISRFGNHTPVTVQGIHESAVISPDAHISSDVAIGPHVVIEKDVRIGERSVIHAGVYIGPETVIGADCIVYPNVTIRERIQIGNQVIIHSGTVIGSDGFGFELENGHHVKIPQVGTVVIEDLVEIGANVTIDRARFDKTFIGKGSKIDNLVQIAHNVRIGENCIIVSQVGISGTVEIGDGSILAGQSGVAGHLKIGRGSVVAAQSGVTRSIPENSKVIGFPARPYDHYKVVHAHMQKISNYVNKISELEERIKGLESKND